MSATCSSSDSRRSRDAGPLLAALIVLCAGPVAAQSSYHLIDLGLVPGSTSSIAVGLNDAGAVVGWASFPEAPFQRGWKWTAGAGFEVLPQPPGLLNWFAVDINEEGVIAGDGGFDSGEAWRLVDGSYEMLGFLPETFVSTSAAINAAGEIAGTSRDPSFTGPKKAFFAAPGEAMEQVADDSWGTFLNDAGQVVGYFGSNRAWRFTPGLGLETLPLPPGKDLSWATSVNAGGDVVGWASHANGNADEPWLFTTSGGTEEIGAFGGDAYAVDVNDLQQVIGVWELSGGDDSWIWTRADGVRFLDDLIEPGGPPISTLTVARINNAGQIVGQAFRIDVAGFRPVLLDPVSGAAAAPLVDLAVLRGSGTGGLAELDASDDLYLEVAAERGGERFRTLTALVAASPLVPASALDLTVELAADRTGVAGVILARNVTTRRWDRLQRFELASEDEERSLPGLDAALYLEPESGRIAVAIGSDAAAEHTMRIDRVEVLVRP